MEEDSESGDEYDVGRGWLYAKSDKSKTVAYPSKDKVTLWPTYKQKYDDDDDKYTKDVNRKETYTEQLGEDEESDDEYDIGRQWLYAKTDESKTDTGTLQETFDTDDVAVIFIFLVLSVLALGIGLFIGCTWKRNMTQRGKMVNQFDYV